MTIPTNEIIREKIIASVESLLPGLTLRDIHLPAIERKAVVAIGMRRSGKTTWLHQCQLDYLQHGCSREDLLYFNFEDERLQGFPAEDLQIILDTQSRLFPRQGNCKRVLFMDEIQLVPGWEMFIRRILDEGGYDIYLSGSSAKLLSREIASSMRGRAWEVEIFPFSFKEALNHRGYASEKRSELLSRKVKSEIDHYFEEYLFVGGLPEAQGLERTDRLQLLQSYVDALLMRDIVDRHHITNPTALRWMVRRLMASPGGLFSISKFSADLKSQGISVGKETLFEYLDYLQDAYLLETISIASDSVKRKQVNPRKVYPIDPGFIPLFDRSAKSNIGHALETAVYIHLRRQKADITYVKTHSGYEVDFLARYLTGEEQLIQVCFTLEDPDVFQREVRSLQEASSETPRASLLLLTGFGFHPKQPVPENIRIIPAWEWMMG